ncbi:hypothetical protein NliqN6_1974 [Naganishia liquefaciens]|uniref:Uncharacterized protein n=1 Tax=Naganishia liquefaciens TaxID=104408 RepID=A0A8H3YET5_9TREE|nr:hypothetical protein NliqN6_1974 [Naganishia liquefaciens]
MRSNTLAYAIFVMRLQHAQPIGTGRHLSMQGLHLVRYEICSYMEGRQKAEVELAGSSIDSGSCQFSMSYDTGLTWNVILSSIRRCLADSMSILVDIPTSEASSGEDLFSRSWFDIEAPAASEGNKCVGPGAIVPVLPQPKSKSEGTASDFWEIETSKTGTAIATGALLSDTATPSLRPHISQEPKQKADHSCQDVELTIAFAHASALPDIWQTCRSKRRRRSI